MDGFEVTENDELEVDSVDLSPIKKNGERLSFVTFSKIWTWIKGLLKSDFSDTEPAIDSDKFVTSSGIKTELNKKQDIITSGGEKGTTLKTINGDSLFAGSETNLDLLTPTRVKTINGHNILVTTEDPDANIDITQVAKLHVTSSSDALTAEDFVCTKAAVDSDETYGHKMSDLATYVVKTLTGETGKVAEAVKADSASQIADSSYTYTPTTVHNELANKIALTSANRPGVTRLYRRDDDSNYNVQTNWDGTYWNLYGYTGDTAHAGCKVAYADSSGAAANASKLAGYSAAEAATGSTVALRNAYGYISATYFNQSSGVEDNGEIKNLFYDNGDGYLRKVSLDKLKEMLMQEIVVTGTTLDELNSKINLTYNSYSGNKTISSYATRAYGYINGVAFAGGIERTDNGIRVGPMNATVSEITSVSSFEIHLLP